MQCCCFNIPPFRSKIGFSKRATGIGNELCSDRRPAYDRSQLLTKSRDSGPRHTNHLLCETARASSQPSRFSVSLRSARTTESTKRMMSRRSAIAYRPLPPRREYRF